MKVLTLDASLEPVARELPIASAREALREAFQKPDLVIEGVGARGERLIRPGRYHGHGFVDALGLAFALHRPVVFSPDDVWLLLVQGYALAVPEVDDAEKTVIEITREDFVPGGENPWPEAFEAFSEGIRNHIGDDEHELIAPTFSTTGPLERAAAEVAMMSALRDRFRYRMDSVCGIPEVRLLGTKEDWVRLREAAEWLVLPDALAWWEPALMRVLDEFVAVWSQPPRLDFWRSIYKFRSMSGGDFITGWINVLLPWTEEEQDDGTFLRARNPETTDWEDGFPISPEQIPSPLARAPVEWRVGPNRTIHLDFLAGFLAVEQLDDGAFRPAMGWAVVRR